MLSVSLFRLDVYQINPLKNKKKGFRNGYHIFSIVNDLLGNVSLIGSLLFEIIIIMGCYSEFSESERAYRKYIRKHIMFQELLVSSVTFNACMVFQIQYSLVFSEI